MKLLAGISFIFVFIFCLPNISQAANAFPAQAQTQQVIQLVGYEPSIIPIPVGGEPELVTGWVNSCVQFHIARLQNPAALPLETLIAIQAACIDSIP